MSGYGGQIAQEKASTLWKKKILTLIVAIFEGLMSIAETIAITSQSNCRLSMLVVMLSWIWPKIDVL